MWTWRKQRTPERSTPPAPPPPPRDGLSYRDRRAGPYQGDLMEGDEGIDDPRPTRE
jgi:hypothetical protein